MRAHYPHFQLVASVLQIGAAALAVASAPTLAQSTPSIQGAAPTTVVTKPVPALQPLCVQFDITSVNTGRTYRIYVSRPVVPAPAKGYGALYVLDGGTAFATAATQAVLASLLDHRKPLVVVGIDYPDTLAAGTLRTRDLSPYQPTTGSDEKVPVNPADWGGADAFHKFMMEELRPVIEAMASIEKGDQSLMGYSLGGLFALHVMFTNPEAYQNYVIGSPAIFHAGKKVLEDFPGFKRKVEDGKVAPRILITSAELEQSTDSSSLPESFKMVDNARDIAGRLRSLKGKDSYRVDYTFFAGETHNGGIPASTSRGVAFVEAAVGPARK